MCLQQFQLIHIIEERVDIRKIEVSVSLGNQSQVTQLRLTVTRFIPRISANIW